MREEHPLLFFQPVPRQSFGSIVFPAPRLLRPQLQCYSQGEVWHYCDIRNSGLHLEINFTDLAIKTETLCPTQVTGALSPPLVPHLKKQLTSCTNTPSLCAIQIPIFYGCLNITQ